MAIDSSLFGADIPAGTYAVGDVVPLVNLAGPANVRSGRGEAVLKEIMAGSMNASNAFFEIHVKNSDWIDEAVSFAGPANTATSFDDESGNIQHGCDARLTANSGWQVFAVCVVGATTTAANSLFVIIDIDYPQVSAIQDPDALVGVPTSISMSKAGLTLNAFGSISNATWHSSNEDYFKAGYQYCLKTVEMLSTSAHFGFVAFSSAAGMGGLQRIVPVNNNPAFIRHKVRYSTKLVKGPMDVKIMLFGVSAGTADVYLVHDYVKRSA